MKMYQDITKDLEHEPIMKNGKLFIRLHYNQAILIATINHRGDIQRQDSKRFKVFWDMGVLKAFEFVENEVLSDALVNRGFDEKKSTGTRVIDRENVINYIHEALQDGVLYIPTKAIRDDAKGIGEKV